MQDVTTMTLSELEIYGDQVKSQLLNHLYQEGILTQEQTIDLMLTRTILIKKPGLISRLYRKLLGKEDSENIQIIIAKISKIEPRNLEQE